ncbi:MAG: ShlB/FhaC/HecB family hemolysin secretion/activation protein [Novosphingobium sp.]|nr:ShlB/FhaC/HecB family hemolysin secretion/activation protein [Novosphingobium sp.]
MTRRLNLFLFMCAAMVASSQTADAQQPGPSSLRDRTGPNSEMALPDYSEPREATLPAPPAPLPPPVSGTALFSAVEIEDAASLSAPTRPNWQPQVSEDSDIALSRTDALDADWIREQFRRNGMIDQPVPLDRLVSLIQLINRAFIANGYINSGVLLAGQPPQDGGTLSLRLIAGRAVGADGEASVSVGWGAAGPLGLSETYIKQRMTAADDVPLNAIAIERQFRQLTEDPAIATVNADLQPGGRPGEARLSLIVDPAPRYDLYLTAANNRSPSIGGERFAAGGAMRNAFRAGDLLSAEAGITGGRGDALASYEIPVFDPATSLLLRGGYNDAAVVDPQLRPLGIEARDWHIEGGVSRTVFQRPLLPGRNPGKWQAARTVTLGLRVTHRKSRTYLLGEPFSFSPGSVNGRTEFTALRLTADWIERGIGTVFALSLTGTQGLDGTRSDIPGLLSPDRDFRSIRAQASLARRLGDKGLELRARLGGQWADGILYSAERFSAGGAQSVRGYRETLLLADTGISGSLELAQSFSLTGKSGAFDIGRFTLSAFVDGALLHNREGPQPVPNELYSIGASLAWNPSSAISARVSYGHALKDVQRVGSKDLQDHGVHFSIVLRPLEL